MSAINRSHLVNHNGAFRISTLCYLQRLRKEQLSAWQKQRQYYPLTFSSVISKYFTSCSMPMKSRLRFLRAIPHQIDIKLWEYGQHCLFHSNPSISFVAANSPKTSTAFLSYALAASILLSKYPKLYGMPCA
jgi:hypothetical protein